MAGRQSSQIQQRGANNARVVAQAGRDQLWGLNILGGIAIFFQLFPQRDQQGLPLIAHAAANDDRMGAEQVDDAADARGQILLVLTTTALATGSPRAAASKGVLAVTCSTLST